MTRQDVEAARDFSPGIQQGDIPVPLQFRFDKENSYSLIKYSSGVGSFRSWVGYYYGDQQVGNLMPWYLQQMSVDGWTYRDTREETGKKRLNFVKADETATIWLYREFDHRTDRYHTVVKAEIHPTPIQEIAPEELLASEASLFKDRTAAPAPAAARRGVTVQKIDKPVVNEEASAENSQQPPIGDEDLVPVESEDP